MTQPNIVCVVPTCRPERMTEFWRAWRGLFEKHKVTVVTVYDGEEPQVLEEHPIGSSLHRVCPLSNEFKEHRDLFCRRTDAIRNLGFVVAAQMKPDYVLTLDDDVAPVFQPRVEKYNVCWPTDPIQAHIDALNRRIPISWMNTAHNTDLYVRGVPYSIRDEAPVMLSHGVWVGTPDFDGETQLRLEEKDGWQEVDAFGRGKYKCECGWNGWFPDPVIHVCPECGGRDAKISKARKGGIPHSLPYYIGPIPRGTLFPLCGMNVMVRREALPLFYFAPMGPDAGVLKSAYVNVSGKKIEKGQLVTTDDVEVQDVPALHRFADIYMGIHLKQQFDLRGWACYTGASTVLHTRASDAKKNFEQEKLGREWLEYMADPNATHPTELIRYLTSWASKRIRYEKLIRSILESPCTQPTTKSTFPISPTSPVT